MREIVLSPRENMIERIVDYIIDKADNTTDYSSTLAVFPNKRPKHFMMKCFKERIRKAIYPPKIFSMDELIDYIFYSLFKDFKDLSFPDNIYLLYQIISEDFPDFLKYEETLSMIKSFYEFYPLGLKIFDTFEELFIEMVSPEKLQYYDFLISSYNSFYKVYEMFYKFIENNRFATRAFKYRKVAESENFSIFSEFNSIIFCGFFGLTKAEKKFFKKLDEHFQNGEFSDNITFWLYEKESTDEKKPNIKIYQCPDRHGQIYLIGNILNERKLTEDTVVVLPYEDLLFPLLRQGLTFLEEKEYNISMGYPIIRTPIWNFFECLSLLLNNIFTDGSGKHYVSLSAYLQFVLHPYVKNIKYHEESLYFNEIHKSASLTRIIFHSIENYFSEEGSIVLSIEDIENSVLEKIYQNTEELKEYSLSKLKKHLKEIHKTLIFPFLKIDNLMDFASKCNDAIEFIYLQSTARYHPLFFPFYQIFLDKLRELCHSLAKETKFKDIASYFNFLKGFIKNVKYPFEGFPVKGLQILGFLETRNIRFKTVFFPDLNEEIFPPLYEDYIMPLKLREALELPTVKDREKLIEYYFRVLINAAEEVHLFYVRDEKRERSRFLEKIIWEKEKLKESILTHSVSYKVNLSAVKPQSIEKNETHLQILKNIDLSPSAIDTYLKCPLKFYYSYLLRLRNKQDTEIDSTFIGTIVHNVLENYFRLFVNKNYLNSEDIDITRVEKFVKEKFEERYGHYIAGNSYLIMMQIIKRIKETLEKYYLPIIKRKKLKIIEVEYPFVFEWINTKITGRIDLIEERDGRVFIVDFKISGREELYKIKIDALIKGIKDYESTRKSEKNEYLSYFVEDKIGSIQIPLYIIAYSKEKKISFENIEGIYLLIGKSRLNNIEFKPLNNSMSQSEVLKYIKNLISMTIEELFNLQIPFYPTKNLRKNCQYCDYQTVCGTLWIKPKL